MAGINKVILIGNLGKDPEVMTFENGVKRASFSLATNESYKDKDGNWVEQTEWHNIVLWRQLADRNLIKGDQVYIEGKLKSRSWDDKDGNKRYITEIVADKILKLASRTNQPAGINIPPPHEVPEQYNVSSATDEPTDDLPF